MLRAEQIPDEVVEATAWAMCDDINGEGAWDETPFRHRPMWRSAARASIAAAINAWPGMPCSAANCENSMATPDRLPSMPKHILDQDAEIKMYRKTLRDIVRQCNNSGYGSPAVMERMIDRIEDMAIDVLGDAPKKSRTKAEGWEGL